MKYRLPILFFCLGTLILPGQTVPVGLEGEPEKPVVIANPATGKALLVFYPQADGREKTTRVRLEEVHPGGAARPGATGTVELALPNRRVSAVCSFVRDGDYYFVLQNHRDCRLLRVSGADLSIRQTDAFQLAKGQWVVQGVANGPDAYVLCAQKKGRRLTVYAVDAAGKFAAHPFRVPDRSAPYFTALFKKNIRPVATLPGTELEPGPAAVSSKLYAAPGRLRMTHDVVVGSTPTYRSVALRVFEFDLEKNALSTQAMRFTDSTYFMEDQAGASYLLDDKIFQVYLNPGLFALRVRDLSTGTVRFDKQVRPSGVVDFANTPVVIPERGLKAAAREYRSGADFIDQFSKFVPFIQVRRAGDDYLVQIGGYVEVGASSLGYVEAPTGADPLVPGLYTRDFGFYVVLDGQTLRPDPAANFPATLSEAFRRISQENGAMKHRELHRLGDRFYLGYYDPARREYAFQRVPGY